MVIKIIKYFVESSMLMISALPVLAPKRFQYFETRISLLCCAIAVAVLCLSIADDIISARQTKVHTEKLEKRITAAEEAATPIPLTVRVRDLLQEIDAKIIPAIKTGQTEFKGGITASQFVRLQTITKEDGTNQLIVIDPSSVRMGIGMGPEGVQYNLAFKIDPQILQDP